MLFLITEYNQREPSEMGENELGSTSNPTQELKIKIPEDLETTLRDEFCIYSVPPPLRQINSSAYTPQLISIGPIHHGKLELQHMEIQKLRYFKEFCKRKTESQSKPGKETSSHDVEKIQKEFSTQLLNLIDEQEVRHCYACDFSNVTSTDFVNMILLDSVFILELLLRGKEVAKYRKDFILGKPWLRDQVQHDLILLENQLPFSILEKLYNFAIKSVPPEKHYPSLHELTCKFFSNLKPNETQTSNPQEKILHFTDLVRYFWTHNHPPILCHNWGSIENVCSITKLHQAGLKLKPAKGKCFLEIEFRPGIACVKGSELQVPCFDVSDSTEIVVRNLMALEQCHYPSETYICNYIRLLDLLIDTAEDVDLLVEKKILRNWLGDSASVADLMNKLGNQIVQARSCYCPIAKELNGYYGKVYNHTMATLRSVYFGDLWRGTGTVAAVVLLALTFLQTVWTMV